jgi:predicted permease
LSSLLSLFADNLLPIFLAAGIGVLISRFLNTNPRPLSQVIFYVFSPCLVFNLITHSQLSDGDILHMMLFAGLMCVLIGTLTWLAGHFFRLERRMMAAVLLTSIFMNAGNFGLSLNNPMPAYILSLPPSSRIRLASLLHLWAQPHSNRL